MAGGRRVSAVEAGTSLCGAAPSPPPTWLRMATRFASHLGDLLLEERDGHLVRVRVRDRDRDRAGVRGRVRGRDRAGVRSRVGVRGRVRVRGMRLAPKAAG